MTLEQQRAFIGSKAYDRLKPSQQRALIDSTVDQQIVKTWEAAKGDPAFRLYVESAFGAEGAKGIIKKARRRVQYRRRRPFEFIH